MPTNKRVLLGLILSLLSSACTDRSDDHPNSADVVTSDAQIQYQYDALGRLIQAVSATGASVQYSYDAVGNITAVRKLARNTLRLIDFVPRSGLSGDRVTVYGSGFDPTVKGNTVEFNGTAATVMDATETALTVQVPTGASSGNIAISNERGAAMSETDFAVLNTSLAPSILTFTPNTGTQGTQVTVTGSNFQLNAIDNKITIGGQMATLDNETSHTATQLTFRVPSRPASGHISLTTPFGTATTPDDFFAIPNAINQADIELKSRLVINGDVLSIDTTSGKMAVLLFEAVSGQLPRFVTQGGTPTSPSRADLYDPSGTKIANLSLSRDFANTSLSTLSTTGTHMLVVRPDGAGELHIKLSIVVDTDGELTMNGNTPITLLPGQNARLSFTTEAGKGHGLAFTGLTFGPPESNRQVFVTLRKADGSILQQPSALTSDGSRDLLPASFSTSGTYFIDFDPAGVHAVSFNAIFSRNSGGPLTTSTNVLIDRPGQNAQFTFAGTQGNSVQLILEGTMDDGDPSTNNSTAMTVFRPNGSGLANGTLSQHDEEFGRKLTLNLSLPETGTYTVLINPNGLISGMLRLTRR